MPKQKMSFAEFRNKVIYCEKVFGLKKDTNWIHYKGGIYKITGFGVETHHGGFLVRYEEISEPDMEFYRPPEEFFDRVKISHDREKQRFIKYNKTVK